MMHSVRVALVSYQVKSGDKDANMQVLADVLSTFADSDIQLFVFPELSISGSYSGMEQDYLELAESVPDGPSATQVAALARHYQTVICAGVLEKSKELYFITHFLCGPLGYIGKQQKLFSQNPLNDGRLSAGQKLFVHHLFGHRCVILACADWLLPEGSYLAGMSEAALIISPTDGMALSRENTLKSIALARAMDTRAHLVAAIGGDTPRDGEAVMAGLVAAPAALGTSELLVCETRKLEEVKVICADLPLQQPQFPWGGLRRRSQSFLDSFVLCQKDTEWLDAARLRRSRLRIVCGRATLRIPRAQDYRLLGYLLLSDVDLRRKLGISDKPLPGEKISSFRQSNEEWCEQMNAVSLAIVDQKWKAIGLISLAHFDEYQRSAEVSYWLGSKHWGHGYGSEALALIFWFALKLGIHNVSANISRDDVSSMRMWSHYQAAFTDLSDGRIQCNLRLSDGESPCKSTASGMQSFLFNEPKLYGIAAVKADPVF